MVLRGQTCKANQKTLEQRFHSFNTCLWSVLGARDSEVNKQSLHCSRDGWEVDGYRSQGAKETRGAADSRGSCRFKGGEQTRPHGGDDSLAKTGRRRGWHLLGRGGL